MYVVMKTHTKIFLALSTATAALGLYAFMHSGPYGRLCEQFGGKWASVSSTCVTRSCYKNGTCGYWSNPAVRCDRLKTNDHISEVYFQLGEPDRVDGNRYIWYERKGGRVVAEIKHESLRSLACAT